MLHVAATSPAGDSSRGSGPRLQCAKAKAVRASRATDPFMKTHPNEMPKATAIFLLNVGNVVSGARGYRTRCQRQSRRPSAPAVTDRLAPSRCVIFATALPSDGGRAGVVRLGATAVEYGLARAAAARAMPYGTPPSLRCSRCTQGSLASQTGSGASRTALASAGSNRPAVLVSRLSRTPRMPNAAISSRALRDVRAGRALLYKIHSLPLANGLQSSAAKARGVPSHMLQMRSGEKSLNNGAISLSRRMPSGCSERNSPRRDSALK